MILIHRNPGRKWPGSCARPHHRGRPRRKRGRALVFIPYAVRDSNLRTRRRQLDLKLLLQVGGRRQLLSLRRETSLSPLLRNRDRSVVGIIRSLHFRGHPQAVATIKAELGTSGLPRIFLDFMEQVLSVAKSIEQNPWTDIGGYDQLDHAIGQSVRIVPAPV